MPAPKGQPKQTNQTPMGIARVVYKQPPAPKMPKAIGKQQAMTESGVVNKIKKDKQGDLVSRANPNAVSIPAMNMRIIEVDGDKYVNEYHLQDGTTLVLPKKTRTY